MRIESEGSNFRIIYNDGTPGGIIDVYTYSRLKDSSVDRYSEIYQSSVYDCNITSYTIMINCIVENSNISNVILKNYTIKNSTIKEKNDLFTYVCEGFIKFKFLYPYFIFKRNETVKFLSPDTFGLSNGTYIAKKIHDELEVVWNVDEKKSMVLGPYNVNSR